MLDRRNPPLGVLMVQIVESENSFLATERSRVESEYFDRRMPKQKRQSYEKRVRARLNQRKVPQ